MTRAIAPADAAVRMAAQLIPDILRHAGFAAGILEAMSEAVEVLPYGIRHRYELAGVSSVPLGEQSDRRPVSIAPEAGKQLCIRTLPAPLFDVRQEAELQQHGVQRNTTTRTVSFEVFAALAIDVQVPDTRLLSNVAA